MKKLLLLILFSWVYVSYSQTAPTRAQLTPNNANGYDFRSIGARTILYLPQDTLSTSDSGAIACIGRQLWLKGVPYWEKIAKIGANIQITEAANYGPGTGIYRGKVNDTLTFYTLTAGDNFEIIQEGDSITLRPTFGPADGTETKILPGVNITIVGDGSTANPYELFVPFFVEDIKISNDTLYQMYNGVWWFAGVLPSGGGGGTWGSITGTLSAQTDLQTALNGKQATGNYITATTGDVVATGPGSVAATLASIISAGSCTNCNLTYDAKGRITVAANGSGGAPFILYNALGGTGDTLVNADKEVKWLNPGDGILHSITGTTITQRVDSSKYTTLYNVNNPTPWPKETPYGTIYNRSSWTTTGDFLAVGDQLAAVNASRKIEITSPGGAIAFANAVRVGKPSQLNQWADTVDFKIKGWSGSAAFFGIGKKSISTHFATGYVGYMNVSSSGGGLTLSHESGSASYGTDAGVAINLNDSIRLIMTFKDSVLTFKAANLTTASASGTITLNFTTAGTVFVPNTGTFALWAFLNTVNLIEVQRIAISSTEIRNPNLAGLGDSKMSQSYAAGWYQRFMATLGASYPRVNINAGGADELLSIIARKNEILNLNPEYIIIEAGCNDLRYGTSLGRTQEYMDEIMGWFLKGRAKPYIIVIPEDSTGGGIGLTNFKNWAATKYPNNYIDVWTTMSTSNVLKTAYNSGDGVHPNAAGNTVIDSIIRASGKLATLNTNRRSAERITDGNVVHIGDSTALSFSIERALNRVSRVDDNLNMVASNIYDDGTKVTITTGNIESVQNTSGSGSKFRVNGTSAVTGNEGGYVFYDRTNSANFFASYSDNNIFRHSYNGVTHAYTNSEGRMKIATDLENITIPSILNLKKSYSFSVPQSVIGLGLSLDTNTYTYTGGINAPGEAAISSIGPQTVVSTGSSATFTHLSSFYIHGAPIAGSGTTITKAWALNVNSGKVRIGSVPDSGSATGGYLWRDPSDGNVKIGPGASGADGNGLYGGNGGAGGDGSLPGATTITGAGNTLTLTGTQSSSSAFNVTNTGNGGGGAFSTSGTGTALTGANSSSGNGILATSSSGNGIRATSVSGFAGLYKITPSSTNTVVHVMKTIRGSSGTMAAGAGGGIDMQLTDGSGNDVTGVTLAPVFTSATTGSTTTDLQIFTTNAGSSTLKFTLKGNGQLRLHSYTTDAFPITATNILASDASGNVGQATPAQINALSSLSVVTADPDNWTAAISTFTTLPDLAGAGGSKTVTLPSAAANVGKTIQLWCVNTSVTNTWSFAAAVTTPAGTTSTTIVNGTYIELFSYGTGWLRKFAL